MKKGQTSSRGGYQDFLCPFTTVYVSQWDNGGYSHKGTKAYDITNGDGKRAAYYAPCDCKCVVTIPSYGQALWQSTKKVRLANGKIDYVTFITCHDNSFDAKVGLILKQGQQLGNMGTKSAAGNVTGVHCHFEIGYGQQKTLHKNKYNNWMINNEITPSEACFMDNTTIKKWKNTKYLKDVPVTKTMTVITPLNFRKTAGVKGKLICCIPKGKKVEYLGNTGKKDGYTWYKIKYNGNTGYAVKDGLK